jgi:hypothetical protein
MTLTPQAKTAEKSEGFHGKKDFALFRKDPSDEENFTQIVQETDKDDFIHLFTSQ